jgi:glycosyltransferase involved in cell wall biosynthesis
MKHNLHIGIDGNEANVVNRVGSNHYAYQIIKALSDDDQPVRYTIYLKADPVADMPIKRPGWTYRVLKPKVLWTQWRLPLDLYTASDKPRVFFSPGHYAPRFSPVPTVISIMDLAFLKYPNLFLKYQKGLKQLTSWTAYSVKQAAHVIAISENTKKDITKSYQKPKFNITVAYPGIDHTRFFRPDETLINQTKLKYGLGKKYILYVGTIQPRKNLTRLLRAFETLPRTYRSLEWVIVGQKGWLYENFDKQLKKSPKKNLIKQLGFVDQKDLPALYAGAECTCLVGLYEGFGIPPAQSLACGTIPVVSNSSSLPEVVGKGGITVNPFSLTSIKRGILYALKLPKHKKYQILAAGQSHIRQFTWQRSADKVRKVLYDLALQR